MACPSAAMRLQRTVGMIAITSPIGQQRERSRERERTFSCARRPRACPTEQSQRLSKVPIPGRILWRRGGGKPPVSDLAVKIASLLRLRFPRRAPCAGLGHLDTPRRRPGIRPCQRRPEAYHGFRVPSVPGQRPRLGRRGGLPVAPIVKRGAYGPMVRNGRSVQARAAGDGGGSCPGTGCGPVRLRVAAPGASPLRTVRPHRLRAEIGVLGQDEDDDRPTGAHATRLGQFGVGGVTDTSSPVPGTQPIAPPDEVTILALPAITSNPNIIRGVELELTIERAGTGPVRLFYFGKAWGEHEFVPPGGEITRVTFNVSVAEVKAMLLAERVTGRVMNYSFVLTGKHLAALRLFAAAIGVSAPRGRIAEALSLRLQAAHQ